MFSFCNERLCHIKCIVAFAVDDTKKIFGLYFMTEHHFAENKVVSRRFIFFRKGKPLLMLQCIKRALKLGEEDPR